LKRLMTKIPNNRRKCLSTRRWQLVKRRARSSSIKWRKR
jgi:hypothetical protein